MVPGVAVIVAVRPLQITGLFTVTVGSALMVTTPEPLRLTQFVAVLVTITLYDPAVAVVKLATLPGLVAPAGVVHA
jgi:hypothetical protein